MFAAAKVCGVLLIYLCKPLQHIEGRASQGSRGLRSTESIIATAKGVFAQHVAQVRSAKAVSICMFGFCHESVYFKGFLQLNLQDAWEVGLQTLQDWSI